MSETHPVSRGHPCIRACASRNVTNEHQPCASATSTNVRERNLNTMGEAPVKYELTGASCHLRAEARGVA